MEIPSSNGIQAWLTNTQTIAQISLVGLTCLGCLSEAILSKQVWRLFKPSSPTTFSVSLSGEKTRAAFLTFLWTAGLARLISLAWMLLNWESILRLDATRDQSLYLWNYVIAVCLPAIMFLSTYSVIVLFWAQVYYTARFMVLSNLKTSYWFISAGIYLIVCVTAGLTRILGAYSEFQTYLNFFTGLLFSAIGAAFCFFGIKVAIQFSGETNQREQDSRRSAVVRRVLLLSLICPFLFEIRGLYNLGAGAGLIPVNGYYEGQLTVTWDILTIFLSEWIPSVFVLLSFWPKDSSPPLQAKINAGSSSLPAPENPLAQRLLQPTHESYKGVAGSELLMNFAPATVYPLGGTGPSRMA